MKLVHLSHLLKVKGGAPNFQRVMEMVLLSMQFKKWSFNLYNLHWWPQSGNSG